MQQVIPNVDILIESFRPGVMERLELGPSNVHAINPNLIYVRVSGYGHSASSEEIINKAGRDINFLAASGVLGKFRRNDKIGPPVIPANVLSYYSSGSTFAFV
jgi:alpha-methylacyl-CoA racemase